MQAAPTDTGKPFKILISVSPAVFEASTSDRANRAFSDLADRLLRSYYFDQQPEELGRLEAELVLQKKAAEPFVSRVQVLEAKLAAARQKAAQDDSAAKQGVDLRKYARWRLALNPRLSFAIFEEGAKEKGLGAMLSAEVRKTIFRDEQESIEALTPAARENLRQSYQGRGWEASA